MIPREIKEFDKHIDNWIQNCRSYGDSYTKEVILKKAKIVAEYRHDNTLVKMIEQKLGI